MNSNSDGRPIFYLPLLIPFSVSIHRCAVKRKWKEEGKLKKSFGKVLLNSSTDSEVTTLPPPSPALENASPCSMQSNSCSRNILLTTPLQQKQRTYLRQKASMNKKKIQKKQKAHKLEIKLETISQSDDAEIKLVRIQGIEPKLEISFAWVVKDLMNSEPYLHICVYIKVSDPLSVISHIGGIL